MNIRRYMAIAITLSFILSGCTSRYEGVNSTIKEALFGFDDAVKSSQEIADLPYASASITIDEGAKIFVVLALAEPSSINNGQTQLKWTSTDFGMFVTENGRLVKTLRLPTDNLAGFTSTQNKDPLQLAGKKPDVQSWQANYDWQPDYRFGFPAYIEWRFDSDQTLRSDAWVKDVRHYKEFVHIPSLNQSFVNQFWLDKTTHEVVRSIQYIGPEMPAIDMTILKPYAG